MCLKQVGFQDFLGVLANRRAFHVLRGREPTARVCGAVPGVGVDDRVLPGLQLPGKNKNKIRARTEKYEKLC